MTEIWDTKKKGMVFTKVKDQKAICISASNIVKNQKHSTSYLISEMIAGVLNEKNVSCEILDLRKFDLTSCTGCEGCRKGGKCSKDADFNKIYEKITKMDYIFFISPHCAPIPAKLSMLLEKMEKIISTHGHKEGEVLPMLCGKLAGIISYGEGERGKYQNKIVNDIISDALDRIRLKTIPYNSKWDTGICLPVDHEYQIVEQGYDMERMRKEIGNYVKVVVQTAKSLYAIR